MLTCPSGQMGILREKSESNNKRRSGLLISYKNKSSSKRKRNISSFFTLVGKSCGLLTAKNGFKVKRQGQRPQGHPFAKSISEQNLRRKLIGKYLPVTSSSTSASNFLSRQMAKGDTGRRLNCIAIFCLVTLLRRPKENFLFCFCVFKMSVMAVMMRSLGRHY